jgi:Zn-dependent protease with chaperone function
MPRRGEMHGVVAPAPPWLLFWVAVQVAWTIPRQWPTWRDVLLDLVGVTPDPAFSLPGGDLLRLADLLDLVPALLILAAVTTVLAARLRAWAIERRYRLTSGTGPGPASEIADFVHRYAPGVAVQHNVLRTDLRAFAYARGPRRPCLAIFGGLVVLWRRDVEAARAVVRHELSHCRQKDALLVGALSQFEFVLRRWLWIFLFSVALPTVAAWAVQVQTFLADVGPQGLGHSAGQVVTVLLPGLFAMLAAATLQLAGILVLPVAASWSAEWNADWAATEPGREGLARALSASTRGGAFRWLVGRITHPPTALRRRLLQRGRPAIATAAGIVYPAAWLVSYVCQFAAADVRLTQADFSLAEILGVNGDGLVTLATTSWPLWLAAALLVFAWRIARSPHARELRTPTRQDG